MDRGPIIATAYAALQGGAFADVIRLTEPLHARNGNDMEAGLLLGIACGAAEQPVRAAALLDHVAKLRPEAAHPASDLIGVLETRRRLHAVVPYLEAALALAPDDHRLLTCAGGWFQGLGDHARADKLLERAIGLRPNFWPAQIARAAVDADRGNLVPAVERVQRAIAAGGGQAAAHANLGVMLAHLQKFDEADAAFRVARRMEAGRVQIAYNHGEALLKAGRLAEGWPAYNIRLHFPGAALLPMARLLPRLAAGARLDGRTVLLTHDAGFGDTLQFIRYAKLLAARGARVVLWVPPALHRLLARVEGIAQVFSDDRAWPMHDWHCPVMRLPEVFGTTLDDIPAAAPYVHADAADAALWRARLPAADGTRRIGLVWAGGSRENQPQMQAVDRRRSIDPALLAPLLGVPGVRFVALQIGRPGSGLDVIDPMDGVRDFADTAAIIEALDAVVSVDTAVAHLAGAMGKPVYLLDRFDNCWRWLSGRKDSPWYPSLRIFRQREWGDWSGAIGGLVEALRGDPNGS